MSLFRYPLIFFSLFLSSCALLTQPEPYPRLSTVQVYSPALIHNQLGDSAQRAVSIYLPPSYMTHPNQRYPTLYLLHGYGLTPDVWTSAYVGIQHIMDRLIKASTIGEMIIVMPNADTHYRGSFYHNSSVTGNWEDFIVTDLVTYVDRHYRTSPSPTQRGIAGHSMGGHGALHLAFQHPDVFTAVWAFNPCCLGFGGGIGHMEKTWHETLSYEDPGDFYAASFKSKVQIALAASLSPNPDADPFLCEFPVTRVNNKLQKNHRVHQQWADKMPLHQIAHNLDNIRQLQGIGFDAGEHDFPHIPATATLFSNELKKYNIPHQFDIHKGGHFDQVKKRVESHLLPFFSRLFYPK